MMSFLCGMFFGGILAFIIAALINVSDAEHGKNGTIIECRTCDNCRNQNSNHGVCDICHEHKCWTAKESEYKAENTVPEEIYTQEYLARKDAELKLYKIEQIIKDHDNDRIPEDYWYIDKIREVLEDGRN